MDVSDHRSWKVGGAHRASRLAATAVLTAAAFTAGATAGGPASRLLVTGWSSSNVASYDASTGNSLGALVPTGLGGLNLAHSIRLGPDGMLYVTSTGGHGSGRRRATPRSRIHRMTRGPEVDGGHACSVDPCGAGRSPARRADACP